MSRLAAAAFAGLALAARAQDPYWYLQVDNDVAFFTDRWYTSGVRVARVSRHGDYELEWAIAQDIHTPEAKRFRFGVVDRAPAAQLLLSLARHDALPTCLQTVELAIGVRGPSALGEQTTEAIHEVIPAREVNWSRQEGDQVEARAAFVRSHRDDHAVLHYGAVVGTDRVLAHVGGEWRVGADVASSVLRFAATPPPRAGAGAWGAFAGASVRGVARDDLLGRSYDRLLPALEHERVVGRVAAGVGMIGSWGSAVFTLVYDSREFEGQRVPHGFGSLVVHLDF